MNHAMEGFELKDLSRSLLDIAWCFGPKGLDGACCQDLGMAEFLALDGIERTVDCPIHRVGSTLGFTKSGATRVVNRLVAKGYVIKRTSASDARLCCLEVTDGGRQILSEAYTHYQAILTRVFDTIDPKRKEALKESLRVFSTLLMQKDFKGVR